MIVNYCKLPNRFEGCRREQPMGDGMVMVMKRAPEAFDAERQSIFIRISDSSLPRQTCAIADLGIIDVPFSGTKRTLMCSVEDQHGHAMGGS